MFRLTYKEPLAAGKIQRENYTCVTPYVVFLLSALISQIMCHNIHVYYELKLLGAK